jgi:hypothetical protein
MSKRNSITKALAEKLKTIDGTGPYTSNLYDNSYAKLKFWDEIQDFPAVYLVPGTEVREYHPADFTWCYLNIAVKVYVKDQDDPQFELETLLHDLETCINDNRVLVYDQDKSLETTEILIQSIMTDEGLLVPYGVGEINLQVRYALQ